MTFSEARKEVHRQYLRWMTKASSVEELDVPRMLDSMTAELRYRRTVQPNSAIVSEIVQERQFIKAALRAYPHIGNALMVHGVNGWESIPTRR